MKTHKEKHKVERKRDGGRERDVGKKKERQTITERPEVGEESS